MYFKLSISVQLLFQSGCHVNGQDSLGNTPWDHVVFLGVTQPKSFENWLILARLISLFVTIRISLFLIYILYGNVKYPFRCKRKIFEDAILIACSFRINFTMDLLIKVGADVYAAGNIIVATMHLEMTILPSRIIPPKLSYWFRSRFFLPNPPFQLLDIWWEKDANGFRPIQSEWRPLTFFFSNSFTQQSTLCFTNLRPVCCSNRNCSSSCIIPEGMHGLCGIC